MRALHVLGRAIFGGFFVYSGINHLQHTQAMGQYAAAKGVPAPIQVGNRWVVERTQSWMNGYGKIRRCFERDGEKVDFFLYLAAAFVTVRALIREARTRYRWDTRPTTRRCPSPSGCRNSAAAPGERPLPFRDCRRNHGGCRKGGRWRRRPLSLLQARDRDRSPFGKIDQRVVAAGKAS